MVAMLTPKLRPVVCSQSKKRISIQGEDQGLHHCIPALQINSIIAINVIKKKTSQWRIQQNCWFVNSNKGKFQIKLFTLIFTLVGIPGIWTSSHSILCLCWSTLDLYQVCCGFGVFFKHLFQARLVLLAQESRTILGMSWHVLPVQY